MFNGEMNEYDAIDIDVQQEIILLRIQKYPTIESTPPAALKVARRIEAKRRW
jgi:hypothetical protein